MPLSKPAQINSGHVSSSILPQEKVSYMEKLIGDSADEHARKLEAHKRDLEDHKRSLSNHQQAFDEHRKQAQNQQAHTR